eukprot:TRINITY_DN4121_c0_g1_i2.p3 TRINITY_DN4121_c0_g1~~TRINITY_DN4121_c0_g1_i2.p3  ORF type:complete len:105 (+),score=14.37 TRINITY_DN4121_c0_g1_i2:120-434(+)
MSWKSAPYATVRDSPTYQERSKSTAPPWGKDQSANVTVKGQQYYTAAQSAPYGNTHNVPSPRSLTAVQKMVKPPYATSEGDTGKQERRSSLSNIPRVGDLAQNR